MSTPHFEKKRDADVPPQLHVSVNTFDDQNQVAASKEVTKSEICTPLSEPPTSNVLVSPTRQYQRSSAFPTVNTSTAIYVDEAATPPPTASHIGRRRSLRRGSGPYPTLCEDNLKKLGRLNANRRIVEDPDVYRPSPPILEWQNPKRSAKPPKLSIWLVIALCCAVEMVITGLVPQWLSHSSTTVFLCVFIPASTIVTSFVTYMSVTRHLGDMVSLMQGINTPSDLDRVVEKLEDGRFSRLREPWFVQVHTIRMFCRLLKYHHGVNPISGEIIPKVVHEPQEEAGSDADGCESAALYSCFSGGSVKGGVVVPSTRRLRCEDPLNDNEAGWDEVMGAPPENKNLIFEILKQIKPGIEMSKLPLPAHILEPRSVLERISDMFVHPDLFGRISTGSTSHERLLLLLQWYMSSFHVKPRGLKKPYNPVLGETFECFFARESEDEVHFFAEQVGHHPPVSVFTAVHTRSGVSVTGSYMLRGRLVSPTCACISIDGRLDLNVPLQGGGAEHWVMSFPSIYISSLLTTPRIEAGGEIKFTCLSSDVSAELSFNRKPFFGGSYDEVKGSIGTRVPGAKALHHSLAIGGKWTEASYTEDSQGCRTVLFDAASSSAPLRPFVPESTNTFPSRVVWEKVTVALREMDSARAQKEKNELEAVQREVRRAREARGEEYLPRYFRILDAKRENPSEDEWVYIGTALPSVGALMDDTMREGSE